MWSRVFASAVVIAWLAAPTPAAAQSATPLKAAIDLYASASYDEALIALDAARQLTLLPDERVTVDQHRMLCLLALGRPAAADEAAVSLLQTRPDFVLTASDASPRVRAMFDQTRRRVLPGVIRSRYADAKRAYDTGDYRAASEGFAGLSAMLADVQVAAADPGFADLRTLVDGFRQLSAVALDSGVTRRAATPVERAAPLVSLPAVLESTGAGAPVAAFATAVMSVPGLELVADPEPVVAAVAAPVATARVADADARPFAPIDIFTFDWRDKDVVPPVALAQAVSGWWGAMGEPPAGTPLGALDLLIDESGRVVESRVYQSVNRIYDTVLLGSVGQWRYKPATKNGRAVKYRRVTGVVSGR